MPSESKAQQKFFGSELHRKRHGEKTETGMSEKKLEDFAATKHKGLPEHKEKEPKRGFMSDAHHGHGRHKRGRGEGSY